MITIVVLELSYPDEVIKVRSLNGIAASARHVSYYKATGSFLCAIEEKQCIRCRRQVEEKKEMKSGK